MNPIILGTRFTTLYIFSDETANPYCGDWDTERPLTSIEKTVLFFSRKTCLSERIFTASVFSKVRPHPRFSSVNNWISLSWRLYTRSATNFFIFNPANKLAGVVKERNSMVKSKGIFHAVDSNSCTFCSNLYKFRIILSLKKYRQIKSLREYCFSFWFYGIFVYSSFMKLNKYFYSRSVVNFFYFF